jgi:hypothetical protein
MPTLWKRDNLDIYVDNNYISTYDNEAYKNFAKAINSDIEMRKYCLKPFHQVCVEECGINWQVDLSSILAALRKIKGSIEQSQYDSLLDSIKNIPSMFIKKTRPTSTRVFLHNVRDDLYHRTLTMNINDFAPMNRLFSTVVTNSYKMRKILQKMHHFGILQLTNSKFYFCNSCKNVSVNPNQGCLYCNSTLVEEFPMYHLPQNILSEWETGGDRFLEVMIFHAIKTTAPSLPIYSNLNIRKNHRMPVREIDVYIPHNRREGCAILATKNPSDSDEKNQAKNLNQLGFNVLLVSTSSTTGKMGQYVKESFLDIKNDANFPNNLLNYLKINNIIEKKVVPELKI